MITPMRLTKCARPPSSVWFTVLTCGVTLFTDTYLYALAVPVLPYTLANRAHVPEADGNVLAQKYRLAS
ncbi:hypothetical protein BJX66DRAFT_346002 [Aspergillus keveii]|uniref:Uncharacterized protein n=1 Tax=Aspergillus keveii TaxID=714993 RepID=A0ABR4FGD8_9EURO